MTARHPVFFVSHGAPDVLLNPGATVHLWEKLGAKLPRPTAILVSSAHWAAREPTVSTARTPETIHDFGGFPDALYAMQYQAPAHRRWPPGCASCSLRQSCQMVKSPSAASTTAPGFR